MKKRKKKHADPQPQTNEPDSLWEPEDIQPEPKSAKSKSTVPCDSVPCSTRLAAVLRDSLNPKYQRGVRLLIPSGKMNLAQASLRKLIPNRAAAERQLGSLMLDAFLMGNKGFPDEVRRAMTEVDAMFNRTRLVELTRRVMPFSNEVDACKNSKAARELIEKRIRRKLYDQEWDRLQKHFGWDMTLPRARARRIR